MKLGLGLSLSGGASTGAAISVEDFFAGDGTTEGYWATDSASSMFTDTGKTTNPVNGSLVAVVTSPSGPDMVQATEANRPAWSESSGLLDFDGSTDAFGVTLSTRTSDMYVFSVLNTSDATFYWGYNAGTRYLLRANSASTATTFTNGAGPPDFYVNGALQSFTNLQTVQAALAIGQKVLVEAVGADLSAFTGLEFVAGADEMDGLMGDFGVMVNPGAEGVAAIRQLLADKHGITLA